MNELVSELPDPFMCSDGRRVGSFEQWTKRRKELLAQILDIEYGPLPPAVVPQVCELNTHVVARLGGARHSQYHLTIRGNGQCTFLLDLLIPKASGPLPVVLNGDGCWCYITDGIIQDVLSRGYILARFNRTEIVPDRPGRDAGLYRVLDGNYAAISAWAWGYHRCLDFLLTLPVVDPQGIVIAGHSRGGKTALLAGATDERIAVTAANNSGACGAGCFRWHAPGHETLADSVRVFPFWFSPRLAEYAGREKDLPFDQHCLKALMAPRALLTTEALEDVWANPSGTWQTHLAAAEVFRFLAVPQQLGIRYRPGPHEHNQADWNVLLDFADWRLGGKGPAGRFDQSPFDHLPPAFSWKAPDVK